MLLRGFKLKNAKKRAYREDFCGGTVDVECMFHMCGPTGAVLAHDGVSGGRDLTNLQSVLVLL